MPKPRKCKVCESEYEPFTSLQRTCSPPCAIEDVKRTTERDWKRQETLRKQELRERKRKLKSKSKWLSEAQTACNAYIRERDGNNCISCGTQKPDIQYCAGHYKTRGGHPALRFHPFNLNSQCNQHCNLQLSGNITEYRPRLVKKIGLRNVEWLEMDHPAQNLTIEDIIEIKHYYKEQLKHLKAEEQDAP